MRPTRYAVATDNYTWRGRQPGGTWGWNQQPQFLPGQKTVGHLLQEAGYRTGLFGKLHFGGTFENDAAGKPDFTRPMKIGPRQWGFTYSYVLLGGHQAPPYCFFENNRVDGDGAKVTQLEAGPRNGGVIPTTGPGLPDWDSRQVGPKLIEKAVAFIDADKSQPFYIHLSTDGRMGLTRRRTTSSERPSKASPRCRPRPTWPTSSMWSQASSSRRWKTRAAGEHAHHRHERQRRHSGRPRHVRPRRGGRAARLEVVHLGRRPSRAVPGDVEGAVPAGQVRNQVVGTHDIVPTFVELAGGKFSADQMLDSVSLAPVRSASAATTNRLAKLC